MAKKSVKQLDNTVAAANKLANASKVMEPLTQAELVALNKFSEKRLKELEARDGKMGSGSFPVNFKLSVVGDVSRGASTDVTPSFDVSNFLAAVIMKYAMTLDNGKEWLDLITGVNGVLGKVVEIGADNVVATIPVEMQEVWANNVAAVKVKFQEITPKNPRAGNTNVSVDVERI